MLVTDDGAGEIARNYPGISNDLIENHETWAYVFFYVLIGEEVVSLVALWFSKKNILVGDLLISLTELQPFGLIHS